MTKVTDAAYPVLFDAWVPEKGTVTVQVEAWVPAGATPSPHAQRRDTRMTTKTDSDAATDRRCALCQQPVQDSPWVCANAERHAFCRVCVEDWKGSFDCPIDGAPVVS